MQYYVFTSFSASFFLTGPDFGVVFGVVSVLVCAGTFAFYLRDKGCYFMQ